MAKQQITQKLQSVGAAWAVRSDKWISPNDGFGAKATYHVHPDASYPHQSHIKRFDNLEEVAGYAKAREAAAAASSESEAWRIMDDFWASLQ